MRGGSTLSLLGPVETSRAEGEIQRKTAVVDVFGARRTVRGSIHVDTDTVSIRWGDVGGVYEVALSSGRLIGAPSWRVAPRDLAWFRKRSRRWQARKARRREYLGQIRADSAKLGQ